MMQARQKLPWAAETELMERILPLADCGVKGKEYKGLWWGCEGAWARNSDAPPQVR